MRGRKEERERVREEQEREGVRVSERGRNWLSASSLQGNGAFIMLWV